MTNQWAARHLTWDNLNVYLRSRAPALIPIAGDPALHLVIEPSESRLAVRGPWSSSETIPDLSQFRNLDTRVGTGREGDWVELGISGRHVLQEAYQLLVLLADRIQRHHDPIGEAIDHIISSYREMLSAFSLLSRQQEIGLYGELLIVQSLLPVLGESEALDSWVGPLGEEHDFGVKDFDLEVKATISEERSHRISSIGQLEPTLGRVLWLVSIMLTSKGAEGNSIGQLVEQLRATITSPENRALLNYKLSQSGWEDEDVNLYTEKYCLRADILTYEVNSDFPALTARKLQQVGIPPNQITNLTYVLRLDGLPSLPSPIPLKDANDDE